MFQGETVDALWHVLLIKFNTDTAQEAKDRIFGLYQTLATDCGGKEAGILYFKVERNLDLRKNIELVEIAIFRDNEALQAFRVHPLHVTLAQDLSKIADWQVGDILLPFNLNQ